MSGFNRGNFASALAGLVVGALLITAIPAFGAAGDYIRAGRLTESGGYVTRLKGGGNPTLRLINSNSRPGLQIRVSPGIPPMVVNSTKKVVNLNADQVDGRHAALLAPRVSTATWSGQRSLCPDGVTECEVAHTDIIAPRAGTLLMGATLDLNRNATTNDTVGCHFEVDNGLVSGGAIGIELSSSSNQNRDENCIFTASSSVGTGGPYRVDLSVQSVRDTNTRIGGSGNLWVMWIPIDGSTGTWFEP